MYRQDENTNETPINRMKISHVDENNEKNVLFPHLKFKMFLWHEKCK